MNPLLDYHTESHAWVVRMSTYAANLEGLDCCINKCHYVVEATKSNCRCGNPKCAQGDPIEPSLREARCCGSCNPQYLSEENRAIVKKEFGIVPGLHGRGFWGPQGCRLPRTHRPVFCLTYTCMTMEKQAPKAHNILHFIRRRDSKSYWTAEGMWGPNGRLKKE